jgi:membrane protein YqaA with SNARE-associated domain
MDKTNATGLHIVWITGWLRRKIAPLPGLILNGIAPKTPGGLRKLAWLKRRIIPAVGLLIAIAIMVGIVLFYRQNPGIFRELRTLGYLGAFIISVILNATVILPVSNMAIMMTLGATLPSPVIVGIVGGLGAGIGELTGYIAGRSGRRLLSKSGVYLRVEGWVRRWGWIAVFIMSIFPFIFDVVGIIAGALRMPLWRFFVACWLGRTVSYVFMTYLASLGFRAIPWFG